jgi:hypothetical protein
MWLLLYDCNESIGGAIVVLCIQDRTFVWSMQKHYSLYVQKEKEQDHSHVEEFEHCYESLIY